MSVVWSKNNTLFPLKIPPSFYNICLMLLGKKENILCLEYKGRQKNWMVAIFCCKKVKNCHFGQKWLKTSLLAKKLHFLVKNIHFYYSQLSIL
jgi:hypothetical protein